MRQLFRQEAIDAQREKRFGEAVRARPLASWVLSLTAVGFAIALVAFLLWAWWAAQRVKLPTVVLTLRDGERVVLLQTTDAASAQSVCDKIALAQAYQTHIAAQASV